MLGDITIEQSDYDAVIAIVVIIILSIMSFVSMIVAAILTFGKSRLNNSDSRSEATYIDFFSEVAPELNSPEFINSAKEVLDQLPGHLIFRSVHPLITL